MESDDDYLSFSPAQEEPSPPLHHRKLKRLKKSINVASEVLSLQLPVEKPFESRDLESKWVHEAFGGERELGSSFEGRRSLGFGDLGGEGENVAVLEMDEKRGNEEGLSESKRCDGDDGEELDCGFDGVKFGEERKETKMDLDFDDIGERFEKKRVNEEDLNESEGCDGDDDDELNCGFGEVGFREGRMETKRVLDFGDIGEGFDGERLDQSGGVEDSIANTEKVRREKKRVSEEDSSEIKGKKKKKKKEKNSVESDDADVKPKDRRREEKVV